MIIEKIFSEQNSNEKLYSILMNEKELSLYSDFQERMYTGGQVVEDVLRVANGDGGTAGFAYGDMRDRLARKLARQRANINSLGLNNEARNKAYDSALADSKKAKDRIDRTLIKKFDLEAADPNATYTISRPTFLWDNSDKKDGYSNKLTYTLSRTKSCKLPNTNKMLLPKGLDYKLTNNKWVPFNYGIVFKIKDRPYI